MSITYNLQPADMKAFLAYNRRHSPQHKRVRYILLSIFVVLSIQYALTKGPDIEHRIVAFIAALIVYLLAGFLAGLLTRALIYARTFTSETHPGLICEHTITLGDDALTEVTAVNEGRHLWSAVPRLGETDRHIFIYIGPNAAHTIPKRAFASPEDSDAFVQRARELHAKARQNSSRKT